MDQALEDAIAATEAEKEQVVSLNAELEALSEALADDSAGAEKLVRTIRLLMCLGNAFARCHLWKCFYVLARRKTCLSVSLFCSPLSCLSEASDEKIATACLSFSSPFCPPPPKSMSSL